MASCANTVTILAKCFKYDVIKIWRNTGLHLAHELSLEELNNTSLGFHTAKQKTPALGLRYLIFHILKHHIFVLNSVAPQGSWLSCLIFNL